MKKFYYGGWVNNSWLINSKAAVNTDCRWRFSPEYREKLERLTQLFPDGGRIILFMEPRHRATLMSRLVHMDDDELMDYSIFTLDIEGEDHMNNTIRYTILVGVSEHAGMTDSLRERAFRRLQSLLMTEGIGCLKKEAIEELNLYKSYGTYEKVGTIFGVYTVE
jgi:hypothetical protein